MARDERETRKDQGDLLADDGVDDGAMAGPPDGSEPEAPDAEGPHPHVGGAEVRREESDEPEAGPVASGEPRDRAVGASGTGAGEGTAAEPIPGKPTRPLEAASGPAPSSARFTRAKDLVREGRIEEALELYRRILFDEPENLKAYNNLGVLYDELGQHELALEQFQSAHAVDPESIEVISNLGAALGVLGRFEEAERELRRGQKLDPENLDVRANLGILYFRRGLYAQAEVELRWVCERDEDHGPAHFYRGEALNRLGRVEPAIEALERTVRLQPENAKAYYLLGILFDRKHMPEEAGRMYRRYRELSTR